MSRRARLASIGALVLAAAAWSTRATWVRAQADPGPASLVERALGPFAGLAATIEWIRADVALRGGREELYYARAERALALQPSATQGWIALAHHLVFDRASLAREPDPVRRGHWVRAGLALLERGAGSAAEPAELAFDRGLILTFLAALEPGDRAWPESAAEAWRRATLAFEQARQLGHPLAAEALAGVARGAARDAARMEGSPPEKGSDE